MDAVFTPSECTPISQAPQLSKEGVKVVWELEVMKNYAGTSCSLGSMFQEEKVKCFYLPPVHSQASNSNKGLDTELETTGCARFRSRGGQRKCY